ncbi:hypothetical protein QR680_006929 [Steinernema hermaphroditum]|uniref:C2H2-type domain-containing protein n=1 Tax=Steinernema hermaphroditum TaxID=289476 RepID=A0AA39LXW9_9BILA|nr:hypothetical protein QR680_006929 [Steinernema hermaphroditum]
MEKVKMNGAGIDRDGEETDLSDEEELNRRGCAPAITGGEEDGSCSDSEDITAVEGNCEVDQMITDCETTDERTESSLRDDLPPRKRVTRVSEKSCLWQCAVCGRKIKGNWTHRRQHIGSHERLCIACPIAKCTSEPLESSFLTHLKSQHKTTRKALSTEHKADVEGQIDRNVATAIGCEMKYFPPSSLISSSETLGKNPVNPYCKKCGKRVLQLYERRDHAALHLNMKIPCPYADCSYSGRVQACVMHLKKAHGVTRSGLKLRLQENEKFTKASKELHAQADLVMSEYFT